MSNENAIVVRNDAQIMPSVPGSQMIESVWRLAQLASKSGMTKARKPEDAFFIAMYGMELGIPPMTALRTIYSISGGVPTCSGEALLALMRKSPKVRVTVPDIGKVTDSVTIKIERLDKGTAQEFTYTKDMAQKAGLLNKDNWKKYFHMMLFWRVVSMAAKAMCSDIVGGLYTIEEIAPDSQVNEQGELVGEIVIESPVQQKEEPKQSRPPHPQITVDAIGNFFQAFRAKFTDAADYGDYDLFALICEEDAIQETNIEWWNTRFNGDINKAKYELADAWKIHQQLKPKSALDGLDPNFDAQQPTLIDAQEGMSKSHYDDTDIPM